MKKLKLAVLTVLAVALVSPLSYAKQIKVGHVVYTMEHQFHQSIAKELQSYGPKMYGVKVIILDGGGKGEKMLAAVENLIAQKVDAISVHSPETALTAKAIELAHAKKIPIVTTLIYPDSKNAPHVQPMETPASYAEGKIAAQQWLKAFPNKPCKVAILNFGAWEQGEVLRFGPFFEGVKAVDPKAELVTILNGQGSTEVSMKITLDILQAHPEVNIFFGGNDEMALGALAACEQKGRGKMDNGKPLTEIIAGVDGNSSALIKIYDPDCSFKASQGAVRDVARAEMDCMMGMIEGKIDMNKFQIIQAYVKEIDYWQTSIEDAQVFLMDNYGYKGKLEADVAKGKK